MARSTAFRTTGRGIGWAATEPGIGLDESGYGDLLMDGTRSDYSRRWGWTEDMSQSTASSCSGDRFMYCNAPAPLRGEPFEARDASAAETILSTMVSAASCSQNRSAVHPMLSRCSRTRMSRAWFRAIFSSQNSAFFFTDGGCASHPCQKQPSKNTAILRPGSERSHVIRFIPGTGKWIL